MARNHILPAWLATLIVAATSSGPCREWECDEIHQLYREDEHFMCTSSLVKTVCSGCRNYEDECGNQASVSSAQATGGGDDDDDDIRRTTTTTISTTTTTTTTPFGGCSSFEDPFEVAGCEEGLGQSVAVFSAATLKKIIDKIEEDKKNYTKEEYECLIERRKNAGGVVKGMIEAAGWSGGQSLTYVKSRKQCFPGDAAVRVAGGRVQRMAELAIGDHVQVMQPSGRFAEEPVIGFLHKITPTRGVPSSLLTVMHSKGEFRATPAHMVFVSGSDKTVGNLQVGDEISVASQNGMQSSRVLAIRRSFTDAGLYAPMTSAGVLVVDGVVASIYASTASDMWLPHIAAHAFLFPVRLYNKLGFPSLATTNNMQSTDEMHPFLEVVSGYLQVDRLQKFAASWATS